MGNNSVRAAWGTARDPNQAPSGLGRLLAFLAVSGEQSHESGGVTTTLVTAGMLPFAVCAALIGAVVRVAALFLEGK